VNLWRDRTFVTYWLSTAIAVLGFQVTAVAMPLVAVLTLHATATDTGLLRAAVALPNVLFGIVAGVWVDRLPRRPILIGTGFAGALVVVSIPVAYLLGLLELPQLYLTSFLAGTLGLIGGLAAGAFLPAIVERDSLVEANSKLATTNSTLAIVGPGVGGFLVQIVTAPIALLAESITSLVGTVVLLTIRKAEPVPVPKEGRRLGAEVAEGIRTVLGHPVLRVLLLLLGFANFFSALAQAVFVLYMARDLRLPPATIGLVFAAAGPGSLVGALLARRLSVWLGIGPAIVIGALVFGLGWAVAPLASGGLAFELPVLMASQFLLFGGAVAANTNMQSLRQVVTPGRLLGRVAGSTLLVAQGVVPVGAILGGLLGQHFGLRPALWVAAAGSLLAMALVVLSPLRGVRTVEDAAQIEPLAAVEEDA
jgi:MFS family permease